MDVAEILGWSDLVSEKVTVIAMGVGDMD